jgi:hypothetical protein
MIHRSNPMIHFPRQMTHQRLILMPRPLLLQ